MKKIVIATSNINKVAEYSKLLKGIEVLSLKDLKDNSEIIEDGVSYIENAKIKAEFISKKYGIDCIADDSGIEIKAMNNEPGIYSARFMPGFSYDDKMRTIINKVKDKDRSCRYVCAIAYKRVGYDSVCFEDYCYGFVNETIAEGKYGFGYDPIFYYPKLDKSTKKIYEVF